MRPASIGSMAKWYRRNLYTAAINSRIVRADCPTAISGPRLAMSIHGTYLNEVLIVKNFVLNTKPTTFTTVMIASAMPSAIRAYSTAVTPFYPSKIA